MTMLHMCYESEEKMTFPFYLFSDIH